MLRTTSILAAVLALICTSCRTPGELVESRVALAVDFESTPYVETYRAAGSIGQYRFAGHEGAARRVVKSGGGLGVSVPDRERSSRGVVSPWHADEILIIPVAGDEVLLLFGDEPALTLRIVTGAWEDLSSGHEIELSLTEESWQRWEAAMRDRFRGILDECRDSVSLALRDRKERVRAARMFDTSAIEPPRIRASRGELTFAFDDVRLEGEVLVSRWHRSPGPLRPGYDERSRFWGPPPHGEPVVGGHALVMLATTFLCAIANRH